MHVVILFQSFVENQRRRHLQAAKTNNMFVRAAGNFIVYNCDFDNTVRSKT